MNDPLGVQEDRGSRRFEGIGLGDRLIQGVQLNVCVGFLMTD